MAQIGLDLEIGIEAERQNIAVMQFAAKFPLQGRFGKIGDVGGHARDRQPLRRVNAS